jgi:hypothetical protein
MSKMKLFQAYARFNAKWTRLFNTNHSFDVNLSSKLLNIYETYLKSNI